MKKGPTFNKFWNFFHGLRIFSSGMCLFFQHNLANFVYALRHAFFFDKLSRPCSTSVPDSRVLWNSFRVESLVTFWLFSINTDLSLIKGFSKNLSFKDFHNFIQRELSRAVQWSIVELSQIVTFWFRGEGKIIFDKFSALTEHEWLHCAQPQHCHID